MDSKLTDGAFSMTTESEASLAISALGGIENKCGEAS